MNRIKDFIYEKNDLLIALIIVALAAFVIMSRVEVIMAYPTSSEAEIHAAGDKAAAEDPVKPVDTDTNPNEGEEPGESPSDNPDSSGEGSEGLPGEESTPGQESNNPPPDTNIGQISIYIEYGATGSQIAQLLVDSGLIPNKETFYDAVSAAGADTRLQAGNFKIPANATPADIIRIITN